MGNTISCVTLTLFEIANELYVAAASGILGMTLLVHHGLSTCHIFRTFTVTAITIGSLIYVFQSNERAEPSKSKVIVITGCDSGLGFSLAHYGCERGFTVFAGFLNLESQGAVELQRIFGGNIQRFQVDVTDAETVKTAVRAVEDYLENNTKHGKEFCLKTSQQIIGIQMDFSFVGYR